MEDQEEATLAMSGQSSMTIPSTHQPKNMPHTIRSSAASLRSFGKPWAWQWITVIVVSLQTLISQAGGRGWGWLHRSPLRLQLEELGALIVLLCSVVSAVVVPTFSSTEPGPDTVVPSPGAGGSGDGAMGVFWKGSWVFSSLWGRLLWLSCRWGWWWTFLMSFCWLIVLISRIPHFWSALEGQGRLELFRWSARKASQNHLLRLLLHCQNFCYGHLAPVCGAEHHRANCHQHGLGPRCWKIPAFQDTLILLELFYFVCSKAGQVIWHCWAGLLKAVINVRSFVSAEDLAPQPAEESTITSVKTSSQQRWPFWWLLPRKTPICPAPHLNTLYFERI